MVNFLGIITHFSQVILLACLLVYFKMVMSFRLDMVVSSHIARRYSLFHQNELVFNDTNSQMLMLSSERLVRSRSLVSIHSRIRIQDQKVILVVFMLVLVVRKFGVENRQRYTFLLQRALRNEKHLLSFARHELVKQ